MTGLAGNSGATIEKHAGEEVGVAGSMKGEFVEEERKRNEEGDRGSSGNRWPRHETLALLKIRSDMDAAFRKSTLKRPLWEDVSRKLAELGYHRNAKKCKEKFENIYKYHKRTKEGRSTRQEGKIYRFSDQLEALIQNLKSHRIPVVAKTAATVTNTTDFISNTSTSMSTSSSSDEEPEETHKKKRKLIIFFESLAKEVIQKQENFQKKFLEVIEKHEHERLVREETWKTQELARMNREHEILMQERSITSARDAALTEFLHKITEQSSHHVQLEEKCQSLEDNQRSDNDVNFTPIISSSRWPKTEVQALIRLRTSLDCKYQENVLKGPLWGEISMAMRKLGFNRSAKRCKEKWENINKYFKKVKERNKRRPEDSKTCPYFDQLEALYKEKNTKTNISFNPDFGFKPDDPVILEPLRQEPLPPDESVMEDLGNENTDKNQEEEGDNEDEDERGDFDGIVICN